jgi:hypothetical protein
MTKQITNYKELVAEKARLNALLAEQELLIKEDWHAIKHELKPFVHVAATVRNFLTRKATMNALQLGVNLFSDGFVKRILLKNAGWFAKLLVPFFIKNYASHVTDEPEKLLHKIKNLFKKKKHEDQETGMDAV